MSQGGLVAHARDLTADRRIPAAVAAEPAQLVTSAALLELLPPHMALVASWCSDADVAALGAAHSSAQEALECDGLWREMLLAHSPRAFDYAADQLAQAPEGERPPKTAPAALCLSLPRGGARLLYPELRRAAAGVFWLSPRARLALLPHELHEWDKVRCQLVVQQQAERIAAAVGCPTAAAHIRALAEPEKLRLASLQAMAGKSAAASLPQLSDGEWGPTAAADLRRLVEQRLVRRREEWQRHRADLLRDLEWH